MSAIKPAQMPVLRGLDRTTRRARLLAARTYAVRSIPRYGILGGFWDEGFVVRIFREKADGSEQSQ